MASRRKRSEAVPQLTVAIVGRPNVGKSTLFNRLVGRRDAIVDDTPGVTRDRREGIARNRRVAFTAIDTAGWEEAPRGTLPARMRDQTARAVDQADLALLVVDARAGLTPADESFARWLRGSGRKVLVLANKCEGKQGQAGLAEAYRLGLGTPLGISAEHGEGLDALFLEIAAEAKARAAAAEAAAETREDAPRGRGDPSRARGGAVGADDDAPPFDDDASDSADDDEARAAGDDTADADDPAADDGTPRVIRMAIVGRPNVGKSSLVNRLLGEDRMLTGPEAGITRDSIGVDWTWQGRAIRLVDTAGLRRKATVNQKLEAVAAQDTLETIRRSEVVVLVLDATMMLEKQDLTIARGAIDEGRALVVVVNKIDLLGGDQGAARELRQKLFDRIEASLAQVKGLAIVPVSVRTGRGLEKLMPAVVKAWDVWNKRIPTAAFNRWLGEILEHHPPPLSKGRRIKIRYGTQSSARPPTFALFVSQAADLPETYARYLVNRLRQDFDLPGTPIRVVLRQPKNPYAERE